MTTSMLQKILQDMFVDPDLLAELDEEQKQILFIKMREEQLRRWREREKSWEEKGTLQKSSKRGLRWLVGADGEPWTWVMGEHSADRTIEQILEQEEKQKAAQLAEQESERIRLSTQEEQLKRELLFSGADDSGEQAGDMSGVGSEGAGAASTSTSAGVSAGSRAAAPLLRSHYETLNVESESPAVTLLNRLRVDTTSSAGDQKADAASMSPTGTDVSPYTLDSIVTADASVEKYIERLKEQKKDEIYESLKEARETAQREAERQEQSDKQYWESQERKAKEAEEQIRHIARVAREQHRTHSLHHTIGAEDRQLLRGMEETKKHDRMNNNNNFSTLPAKLEKNSEKNSILSLPRPPKPKDRLAIIDWFVKEELPRGTGLDPKTGRVAIWFHGIISRPDSEVLLLDKPCGAFLVRVSERIWGYTISYSLGGGSAKHFLVEKSKHGGYQFLGTNQMVHNSLWELVCYHESAPITTTGREVLRTGVGQTSEQTPDFADLMTRNSKPPLPPKNFASPAAPAPPSAAGRNGVPSRVTVTNF